MNIEGKVIVVTGGAGGIGAALCRRFAEQNAKAVVVADVDEDAASALARQINAVAIRCDVAVEQDITALVRQTEARCGPIDVFCSNAGIIVMGGIEVSPRDWQRMWDINVMAHVHAAKAVVPGMMARGGGWFVCTASAAGLLSQIGSMPYAVTKHAAVGFAESLAITYGDKGIKVALVCPQAVATAMTRRGGGVAALDGMIEPGQVAQDVITALSEERFLVLPHPQVKDYMQRKTSDYDRWITGMQRLKTRFETCQPPGR
jgi:NAD(P)-dependent dehydrogenase (short-subunit alcohol dehydrogenase family)